MRILHIITSLEVGGAQTMLYQLLQAWKNDHDQHTVISLVSDGLMAQEIETLEIPVYQLGMRPGQLNSGGLLKLFYAIRASRPELVQTWLYHADLIGGLIARLSSRAPVLWGIHHTVSSVSSLKSPTLRIVRLNALLSRIIPARIICCSNTALEAHALLGYQRNKMRVIRNGVDTNRFQPDRGARQWLRRELRISSDARIIGMFARFHPQKDHRNLIRAAGILHRVSPNVHFVLAGDGVHDRNSQLQQWIASEGINGFVHLIGLRREMPRLYAALDIFTLSSSDGEAMPLVICEAMACGIPCVATDVGEIPQMIREAGRHVPIGDPHALALAWASILDMAAADYRQISRLARKRVENVYNLEHVSKNYADLYTQVIL